MRRQENIASVPVLKATLSDVKYDLSVALNQKKITTITRLLVSTVDDVLTRLFQKYSLGQTSGFCLLALGSYGRRELQLHSDIDVLLLHEEHLPSSMLLNAQKFIQDCWDVGLQISHQITTITACAQLASHDLTVISSLLDMRLVCGRGLLMEELLYQTHPIHMWNSHDFFSAKIEEQHERYIKYGETAYNLEPNVKSGAGGLRDIQTIFYISQRHFGAKKYSDSIHFGFMTPKEYETLRHCQHILWRVRFALHHISGQQEDRLLFDHQVTLAKFFGYQDNKHSLAIEQFMKFYFQVIKRIRELNEMLLQWFSETIVHHQKQCITPLDESFQLSNHYIEARHPKVFVQKPDALMKLFLWIASRFDIKGVRANTIRLIREHLYLVDKRFTHSHTVTNTFLKILNTNHNPYEALQRMSRYGVLGYYLDCFAMVTGQMQYDLFHVYTVDQHTLFVLRNLGRFLESESEKQFALCVQLMRDIKRRDLLYLAGLFHDIAKGRGGDHSELGAKEASKFAIRHGLCEKERLLLVWLVQNHLLMSKTAQQEDIYDPKTIEQFFKQLPHADYLDYLYLLTVADICATNPALWNSWKDTLLKELYFATKSMITHQKHSFDEASVISSRKQQALSILLSGGVSKDSILSLWSSFKDKYFLHEPPNIIAKHTKSILTAKQLPVVLIMPHYSEGSTEIFIYAPHRDDRFMVTTTILNNHQITILEATILTCSNGYDLDTYIVLDDANQKVLKQYKINHIHSDLTSYLANKSNIPTPTMQRLSRIKAHFKIKPDVVFDEDLKKTKTRMFLIAADRPGLLARISRIFLNENIQLHSAKITTAGERVEDVFYLSTQEGQLLSIEQKMALRTKVIRHLGF